GAENADTLRDDHGVQVLALAGSLGRRPARAADDVLLAVGGHVQLAARVRRIRLVGGERPGSGRAGCDQPALRDRAEAVAAWCADRPLRPGDTRDLDVVRREEAQAVDGLVAGVLDRQRVALSGAGDDAV